MRPQFLIYLIAIISFNSSMAQSPTSSLTCYGGIATVILGKEGKITIPARDLISKDQADQQNFMVSFTPNAADSTLNITCQDVPNGRREVKLVTLYGGTLNTPQDSCSVQLLIQDNSDNICTDDFTGLIYGKVLDQSGTPMKDVILHLEKPDKLVIKVSTNALGEYAFDKLTIDSSATGTINNPFPGLPVKTGNMGPYTYKIEAEDLHIDYTSQVSTIDLIHLQKHILGVAPFSNKLNYIAGDVNNDLEINALDLLELRKLILLLIDEFPNNGSYRFFPKSLLNAYNPGSQPHFISSIYLTGPTQYDFIGVKIGDIRN